MAAGVIFDIDGTLIDSVPLHAEAWREALAHFGFHFTYEQMWGQIGKGSDTLLPHMLPDASQEERKEIDEYRGTLFTREYRDRIQPFPDVRELFLRIRGAGGRVAVASSAKGDEVDHYLKLADVADLVEAATSADDAERSKPHSDIFHAALDRLPGLDRGDVLVVGDTPYDAIAAVKAGVRPVGVRGGGWPDDKLREAGCVAVYEGPTDLLKNFDRTPLGGG